MKINGQYPKPPVPEKGATQAKGKEKEGKNEIAQHEVNNGISGLDLTTKRIHEKLNAEPEINQDKVNAIKAKMKQGEYQVDSEKLASRMLKDSILEDLL